MCGSAFRDLRFDDIDGRSSHYVMTNQRHAATHTLPRTALAWTWFYTNASPRFFGRRFTRWSFEAVTLHRWWRDEKTRIFRAGTNTGGMGGGDAEGLGRRVVFLHLVLTCGRSEWRMKMRFVGRGIVPVHR